MARLPAITRSNKEDSKSRLPGRERHRLRRSRTTQVDSRLARENERDEGKRPQFSEC